MRQINDAHVAEPGLAVVEVGAADDQTAFALQEVLATRWATATADRTTRVPGEPGVRLLPEPATGARHVEVPAPKGSIPWRRRPLRLLSADGTHQSRGAPRLPATTPLRVLRQAAARCTRGSRLRRRPPWVSRRRAGVR
ncbi:DUF6207 family protein [Streptomyces mirabilis]|uniref:DUF6207 family protein n=1 Tax=Streptomyces mirabilis TaxID=68239 RepID=UPI003324BFD0